MKMEACKGIALFEEFRELAPAGKAGDEMIRRSGDRLGLPSDLLDRRADLLAHQVEFPAGGTEKAKGRGEELAMVQILNRKPEALWRPRYE